MKVLFHPHYPLAKYAIRPILAEMGAVMTWNPWGTYDLVMAWEDRTFPDLKRAHKYGPNAINHRLVNVSKRRVEQVFRAVFGYGTFVDPRKHRGVCARKLDRNGLHVGRIVESPTTPLPFFVYQRLIDNTRGEYVEDIRLPIFGREIPFAYLKRRPKAKRFSRKNTAVSMTMCDTVLSQRELNQILAFTAEFGLDYGEIDILRDRADGRIYIIDVNHTPWGPPNGLPEQEQRHAVKLMASAFANAFLNSPQRL